MGQTAANAAGDKSIILFSSLGCGPQSVIVTTTVFWFFKLVTLTFVPFGIVLWAAVNFLSQNGIPLDVAVPPLVLTEYQLANPVSQYATDVNKIIINHKYFIRQKSI